MAKRDSTRLVPDEALHMNNYFMFRHDRQFSVNGGGLITYITNNWSVCYPMVCSTISTAEFELLAVRARPRYTFQVRYQIKLSKMYIQGHRLTFQQKINN